MDSGEIILTRDIFRVLASATRIIILKRLAQKRMTTSELSRELDITKSTVHEHLTLMTKVGLVIPGPEDHRWRYYEITEKGRHLLEPDISIKIVLVLSFSGFVMITGSVAAFMVYCSSSVQAGSSPLSQGGDHTMMFFGIGMILLVIGLGIGLQAYRVRSSFTSG